MIWESQNDSDKHHDALAFHGSYIADFVIRVLGVQNIGPGDFNIRTADQTPSASTTTREPIGTRR